MAYGINGRTLVRVPEGCPHALKTRPFRGMMYEYIKIAGDKIGRPLKAEECVHHIDCDCTNNDPDNLLVFTTQKEHSRFHALGLNQDVLSTEDGKVFYIDPDKYNNPLYNRTLNEFVCSHCGKHFIANKRNHVRKTAYCSVDCYSEARRNRSNIPDRDVLENLMKTKTQLAIATMYGVSNTTVRKWARKYNLI